MHCRKAVGLRRDIGIGVLLVGAGVIARPQGIASVSRARWEYILARGELVGPRAEAARPSALAKATADRRSAERGGLVDRLRTSGCTKASDAPPDVPLLKEPIT